MRRKVLNMAGAVAVGLAASGWAEMELTEALKISGFVDMSAVHKSTDSDDTTTAALDQWELSFLIDPAEGVSAQVDIDDQPSADQGGVEVEQAFVTGSPLEGLTLKAGKFLSALGYEGAEPTALYQYSYSATIIGYPGYANGVGAKFDAGFAKFYAALIDGAYSGDQDADSISPEFQIVVTPVEGLTLQAGYAVEEFDATTNEMGDAVAGYDKGIANFWAEYKTGGLTLAGEFNQLYDVQGAGSDGTGYLVMVNYDWGKLGLTLRHSAVDLDNGYENTEYTISPNLELAANLSAIFEVRFDEYEGGDTDDATTYAAELLFVF
ncbi:MAG: porin [Kiritimatiellae bacterium]|nr:porin [Kiritimatiellia bacterium]MDW8459363.1 porin [Verrucomicrobiota bacterium]